MSNDGLKDLNDQYEKWKRENPNQFEYKKKQEEYRNATLPMADSCGESCSCSSEESLADNWVTNEEFVEKYARALLNYMNNNCKDSHVKDAFIYAYGFAEAALYLFSEFF